MEPTYKDLKLNPTAYPSWVICRRCKGDRAELYQELNEIGELINKTRVCTMCAGTRVTPRS